MTPLILVFLAIAIPYFSTYLGVKNSELGYLHSLLLTSVVFTTCFLIFLFPLFVNYFQIFDTSNNAQQFIRIWLIFSVSIIAMTFIAFSIIDNHPTFMNKVDLENDWRIVRLIVIYIAGWSVVCVVYTNYSLSLFIATIILPIQYCIRPTKNKFLASFELIILITMSPLFILIAGSFLLQMDSVQLVVSLLNYFSNFFVYLYPYLCLGYLPCNIIHIKMIWTSLTRTRTI